MRVETKDGGDGVACWNRDAIQAYADESDARESRLARDNPDVVVMPGLVKCYGCEVLELGMGTRCTAELTLTRYGVDGEIQPRAADATGSLLSISGLRTRIDSDAPEGQPTPVAPEWAPSAAPRRPGLRSLFGRSG